MSDVQDMWLLSVVTECCVLIYWQNVKQRKNVTNLLILVVSNVQDCSLIPTVGFFSCPIVLVFYCWLLQGNKSLVSFVNIKTPKLSPADQQISTSSLLCNYCKTVYFLMLLETD